MARSTHIVTAAVAIVACVFARPAASRCEEIAVATLDAPATSGGSAANTYHWIHALQALGHVDTNVTADIPTFAVFNKAGKKTHAAWNPTDKPITVTFADGVKVQVEPGTVKTEIPAR
jgi:hypothetical protein